MPSILPYWLLKTLQVGAYYLMVGASQAYVRLSAARVRRLSQRLNTQRLSILARLRNSRRTGETVPTAEEHLQ